MGRVYEKPLFCTAVGSTYSYDTLVRGALNSDEAVESIAVIVKTKKLRGHIVCPDRRVKVSVFKFFKWNCCHVHLVCNPVLHGRPVQRHTVIPNARHV